MMMMWMSNNGILVYTVGGRDGPVLIQQSGTAFMQERRRPPLTQRDLETKNISDTKRLFIVLH